jgi:predicted  nucleic acid-binding Zn-ribbon protein
MNLIKKIGIGVGSVAVVTAGTLLLTSNMNVGASDEVTMELFNQLKTKVETLESKNTELENKIVELTNADVTINTKIDTEVGKVKTDLTSVTNKVNTNTTNITSITNRTTKIEAREDEMYSFMAGHGESYIGFHMTTFKKEQ